ncbi:MAG: hypothetical protein K2X77_15010 [Candidatus Obscuribacterales bacterium]|jgi:hypothetical protein|nr:hypothetical protein [Candidatus Obscuribacterales bacterium]
MSSSLRGAAEKSFTAQAWDGIVTFILKTVIPLIPIALIVWLLCVIMNAEVTGTYQGMTSLAEAPPDLAGAIAMHLNEENDKLTGNVIFKADIKYEITSGKMLDDNKMQLQMEQQYGPNENDKRVLTFEGAKDQNVLNGVIHDGTLNINVRLTRGSTSSFFGKRWFVRTLNYFGAGIK